jgi:hypothetical protein
MISMVAHDRCRDNSTGTYNYNQFYMHETDICTLQCYLTETPNEMDRLRLIDIDIYISRALVPSAYISDASLLSPRPGMYIHDTTYVSLHLYIDAAYFEFECQFVKPPVAMVPHSRAPWFPLHGRAPSLSEMLMDCASVNSS